MGQRVIDDARAVFGAAELLREFEQRAVQAQVDAVVHQVFDQDLRLGEAAREGGHQLDGRGGLRGHDVGHVLLGRAEHAGAVHRFRAQAREALRLRAPLQEDVARPEDRERDAAPVGQEIVEPQLAVVDEVETHPALIQRRDLVAYGEFGRAGFEIALQHGAQLLAGVRLRRARLGFLIFLIALGHRHNDHRAQFADLVDDLDLRDRAAIGLEQRHLDLVGRLDGSPDGVGELVALARLKAAGFARERHQLIELRGLDGADDRVPIAVMLFHVFLANFRIEAALGLSDPTPVVRARGVAQHLGQG